jgi:hypothetical protein
VWVVFFHDGEVIPTAATHDRAHVTHTHPDGSAAAAYLWARRYSFARRARSSPSRVTLTRVHVQVGGAAAGETGEPSFQDWSFEVIKIAGFLLSHGAQLVYTADDAYNPSIDSKHPGLVFPLPGPGMFAAMMRKLMYPAGSDAVACPGKGGNQGGKYMMERARQMLIEQGHDGDPAKIMMVRRTPNPDRIPPYPSPSPTHDGHPAKNMAVRRYPYP